MWLSLFLFVWCCLCWTKTRNWSLERPKSKVKKPLDCKASLTSSSSGISSTTWKFYCYFPQARSKEIWDFSCNIYSKKDVCGYVCFHEVLRTFHTKLFRTDTIYKCLLHFMISLTYLCVCATERFFLYWINFFSHKLRKHKFYLPSLNCSTLENSLHTPVNLKLIQFLSSVLPIFNQSWSLKLEMYKLH